MTSASHGSRTPSSPPVRPGNPDPGAPATLQRHLHIHGNHTFGVVPASGALAPAAEACRVGQATRLTPTRSSMHPAKVPTTLPRVGVFFRVRATDHYPPAAIPRAQPTTATMGVRARSRKK